MKSLRFLAVIGVLGATPIHPADSEPPAAEAIRLAAEHAHRVHIDEPTDEDPVVFTDISPYTTDEAPVRLPDDQAVQ
jgi:hypothetical protein